MQKNISEKAVQQLQKNIRFRQLISKIVTTVYPHTYNVIVKLI